jgi:Domain of unknown function (DUF4412)
MKALTALVFFTASVCCSYGDLTIVQRVEGAGTPANMTIKIKGNKARIDANPSLSSIIDGSTGELLNLMLDQKKIVRISREKMKAAVEMMNKYNAGRKKEDPNKPIVVPTGKKQKIDGYDTEEYVYDGPNFKASYWVAPQYPNSAAILKELQTLNPQLWAGNNMSLPDYRAFNGVPIKTIISSGDTHITTSLVSINQNSIDAADFVPPKDFREVKVPEIGNSLDENPPPNPQKRRSP